jgi:hypothetical protein
MQICASRPGRPAALTLCAVVVALAVPAGAPAKPVTAELRVEAANTPLSGGASYVTDTARIQTDQRPGCDGSGAVKTVNGATALGLLSDAGRVNRGLRPLSVSDKFEFGLFVCGIGDFIGSDTSFWLYKVDHVSPEVGADQFALRRGQHVLWFLLDTGRGVNTGDELELVAPARARSGGSFEVTVLAYDAAGKRSPAAGALVFGDTVQRTGADGKTTIFSDREGSVRLRAARGDDVPSEPVRVCLNERLSRCPAVRGERIFGTNGGERIRGTDGADRIDARGGNDRVNIRRGGRDRVRCGDGHDRVRAGRRDSVARDCEVVRRR